MNNLLKPEQTAAILKRLETILLVFVLSGGWSAVGYIVGTSYANKTIESLKAAHVQEMKDLQEQQRTALAKISGNVESAAGNTAAVAKTLKETADKGKK